MQSIRRLILLAVCPWLGACSPAPPQREIILDCGGALPPGRPGNSWHDTYTLDLSHRRYCEANCGVIQSIQGSGVVIDLYGDGVHATHIDLNTGAISVWDRVDRDGRSWVQSVGRCERVKHSRYIRYE